VGAVEDILEWSEARLAPWRQDALRRLAASASLSEQDHQELLKMVKQAAGFTLAVPAPTPVPLLKAHLATPSSGIPIKIKAIRNVKNVNRLVPSAALQFAPSGLTTVYGRNGSGKSGFVRILRTACRTRCENPTKLKVLGDVYGTNEGPQQAEIVTGVQQEETVIPWTSESVASDDLQQVAIFDSSAALLYVDGGNEIKFLPFGLGLLHQLNELCLTLKARLEAELQPVIRQLTLDVVEFVRPPVTDAQVFYQKVSGDTSDAEINKATDFTELEKARLARITGVLAASTAAAADLEAVAALARSLAEDCRRLTLGLSDVALENYRKLKSRAVEARNVAGLDAATLFAGEPLPGVGSETWRRLWLAARDYSTAEAYPRREFPVVSSSPINEHCVFCHQVLSQDASERLKRFQAYVEGRLATEAQTAEAEVELAVGNLPDLGPFTSADWSVRVDQIGKRNAELAHAVDVFRLAAVARATAA
jgi:hypothetical protein